MPKVRSALEQYEDYYGVPQGQLIAIVFFEGSPADMRRLHVFTDDSDVFIHIVRMNQKDEFVSARIESLERLSPPMRPNISLDTRSRYILESAEKYGGAPDEKILFIQKLINRYTEGNDVAVRK